MLDVGAAVFDVGTAAGAQQLIEATQELSTQGSLHLIVDWCFTDASIGTNYRDLHTYLVMDCYGAKKM